MYAPSTSCAVDSLSSVANACSAGHLACTPVGGAQLARCGSSHKCAGKGLTMFACALRSGRALGEVRAGHGQSGGLLHVGPRRCAGHAWTHRPGVSRHVLNL